LAAQLLEKFSICVKNCFAQLGRLQPLSLPSYMPMFVSVVIVIACVK